MKSAHHQFTLKYYYLSVEKKFHWIPATSSAWTFPHVQNDFLILFKSRWFINVKIKEVSLNTSILVFGDDNLFLFNSTLIHISTICLYPNSIYYNLLSQKHRKSHQHDRKRWESERHEKMDSRKRVLEKLARVTSVEKEDFFNFFQSLKYRKKQCPKYSIFYVPFLMSVDFTKNSIYI